MKNKIFIFISIALLILLFILCLLVIHNQNEIIENKFKCNGTIIIRQGDLIDEYFCYLGENSFEDIMAIR